MEKLKQVKQEIVEHSKQKSTEASLLHPILIDLDPSDSDSDSDSGSYPSSSGDGGDRYELKKRKKSDKFGVVLPDGFLDPLPRKEETQAVVAPPPPLAVVVPAELGNGSGALVPVYGKCKQFWKAGDYEGAGTGDWKTSGGMDHVRVHPRFLHSNATSHKWVLGAFAELLDNSLDESLNGATRVNIDMIKSDKDESRMLLIEDNGGGMDPDKMRQCMSLGYSLKSKLANTIGQYGNGFKTSTMRLGADVIVFSRCSGAAGKRPTQSIGLLSYTFLRSTGIEDIVVPMLDYEKAGLVWNKMIRSTDDDWDSNVQAILQWSPFSSEAELSQQFNQMEDQGTRIIIYNLWEDDQGLLELDFDADERDIQIRGVNRDDKNIQMAQQYPNSRHFLTYRHSLRSYASILYLRIPPGFRIILRGKDVDHHNIVNDMMMTQEVTYRPQPNTDGLPKDSSLVATITMGFVKDAKAHIDVQGFNVYHKNRLIKPFWRVWNSTGSDGRGVIGVLEANFVEPAHDKQGFERTIVLSRLETKLIQIQKTYWSTNCHKIGYAARRNKKLLEDRVPSPEYSPPVASHRKRSRNVESGKAAFLDSLHMYSSSKSRGKGDRLPETAGKGQNNGDYGKEKPMKPGKQQSHSKRTSTPTKDDDFNDMQNATSERQANGGSSGKDLPSNKSFRSDGFPRVSSPTCLEHIDAEPAFSSGGRADRVDAPLQSKGDDANINGGGSPSNGDSRTLDLLKKENRELKIRLRKQEEISENMQHELHTERDKKASVQAKIEVALRRIENMNKEQENLIDIFSEERDRRDIEEENLRKKLKDASNEIQELLEKVRLLEK